MLKAELEPVRATESDWKIKKKNKMKVKTAVRKHQVNQRKRALKAKKFQTNNAVKNSAIRPSVNEIEFDEESSEGEVETSHQGLNK